MTSHASMMKMHTPNPIPYGLFRYLYNHYEVRYPDYNRCLNTVLTPELRDAVEKTDAVNLKEHLVKSSWLVGMARPDLAASVQALWGAMSPRARGDYLAGFAEAVYHRFGQDEAQVRFIQDQFSARDSVAFTAETACQIGCCFLAMSMDDAFAEVLGRDIDWEEAIDRTSRRDARRWKSIRRLSRRVIDVFLEAALILKRPAAAKLVLDRGADPNIYVWQLERSSNALYPALGYAVKRGLNDAVKALLEHGADPRGSDLLPSRSPLALAVQQWKVPLMKRLLAAGASFDDGPRYREAPMFYGKGLPLEWVTKHLAGLLELRPLEAKPLFHSPHAQGGRYYTLLECVWDDADKLTAAETLGMDLRLTVHETARLIKRGKDTTFCALAGRHGESVKNEALARVQQEWPGFSENQTLT